MNEEIKQSEAQAVADIVTEHVKPQVLTLARPLGAAELAGQYNTPAGVEVLVLPEGLEAHSIKKYFDEHKSAPDRREGVAKLFDLESFVAHANRFKDEGSALFANPSVSNPAIRCVLDYHPAGASAAPRFGRHIGLYEFPLSDEWKAWTSQNGKGMGQKDFAVWLEDHVLEILSPEKAGEIAKQLAEQVGIEFASPAKILELSRGFSVRSNAKVKQVNNLATGEVQVQYATEHQDEQGAPIKVPGGFLVALPVFRGGAVYQLGVRLRYRLQHGEVVWFFDIHRADRVFRHALDEACASAKDQTGLPLFLGSPE